MSGTIDVLTRPLSTGHSVLFAPSGTGRVSSEPVTRGGFFMPWTTEASDTRWHGLTLVERFERKINKTPGGCWWWTGAARPSGYGNFWVEGRCVISHRYAYEERYGNIPDGLTIDHLCRNRRCVNPDHLEAVTQRTNLLRGNTLPAAAAARQCCASGHAYTTENTRLTAGYRKCRECDKLRARARRAAVR